jgi:phenylacetate-CoA ligase
MATALTGNTQPPVLIAALDGHYAGVVTWERLRRSQTWLATSTHALPVGQPLSELTARLNALHPGFVSSYPTVMQAVADEQRGGKLAIRPALIWCGGEWLSPAARLGIEGAFGCPVINGYGASECMSIGFECAQGWMHLNADWVILEPVDIAYQAVPPGVASHTALLTSLANWVQPIIRYDLGDSVTQREGACPCGCGLPAFRVEGRRDDVLSLRKTDGVEIKLFPLALSSAIEEKSGLYCFQIEQTGGQQALAARKRTRGTGLGTRAAAKGLAALRTFLGVQGLVNVSVALDTLPVQAEPGSGKVRQVKAWRPLRPH